MSAAINGPASMVHLEEIFGSLSASVAARDRVPVAVAAAARASFAWRSIDDELAALVYDSTVDADLLAGVRSGGSAARQLSFSSSALTIEVEVSLRHAPALVGQLVPPQPGEVELRSAENSLSTQADDLGRFELAHVPEGPVSLRCRLGAGDASSVVTDWVTL